MSGILSPAKRNAAIERLKKTAERVIKHLVSTAKGKSGAMRKALAALEAAWRAFPECERDEAVPSAAEVLKVCQRLEMEEVERLKREEILSQ